jgi:hypothetical protein
MALYLEDLDKLRGQPLSVILADPEDWVKEQYGKQCNYAPDDPKGTVCEVCLVGGLLLRHGLPPWDVRAFGDIIAMRDSHHDDVDSFLGEKVILDRIVKEYLDPEDPDFGSTEAEEFNDAPGTFYDEVIEICKRFDKEVGLAVS